MNADRRPLPSPGRARWRTLAAGLAIAVSACASVHRTDAPVPGVGAPYEVSVTRHVRVAAPPDVVFAFVAAEDVLPKVLTGYGPLPAVVRTSGLTGPWDVPGSMRVVHLADGSTVREQLTLHARPDRFAYRVWDFGHPALRLLATGGRGEWTFAAADGGTDVSWTYTFTARNAPAAWPLSGIVGWLWRGYMDVCLGHVVRMSAR